MIKVLSDNALRAYIPLLPAVKTRTAPSRYVKMLMRHLSMQRYAIFLSIDVPVSIKLSTIRSEEFSLLLVFVLPLNAPAYRRQAKGGLIV